MANTDESLLQEIITGQQKILDRLDSAVSTEEIIKAIGHVHVELSEQKKRPSSSNDWLEIYGSASMF